MFKKQNQIQKKYYRFRDDRMFCTVLGNHPDLLRKTLSLILDVKISDNSKSSYQKTVNYRENLRSARFDVCLEEESMAFYDLEMETTRDGKKLRLLPKRSRFYGSVSDSDRCQKGAKYSDLGRMYIIFLCLRDPFDLGLAKYETRTQCIDDERAAVDNEITYVYLNANAKKWNVKPELEAFLKYVAGVEHEDIELTLQIEEEVKRYNEDKEWRSWVMTFGEMMDEAVEEAEKRTKKIAERKERRNRRETITRMIQMGFDDGTIQKALNLENANLIEAIRGKLQS